MRNRFRLSTFLVTMFVMARVMAEDQLAVIGYAAPLTEAVAVSGRNAALLAIDEANKSSLRINGQSIQFRLLEQDDKAIPRTAAFVANYLAKSAAVGVVGHWTSACSIAAAPVYNDAGMAQISPYSWSRLYTAKGYRTAFQVISSDEMAMAYAASYLITTLRLKRFFILDDGELLGTSMAEHLALHVEKAGGEIVRRESVNSKTSDFNAPLTRAKTLAPDVIFFSGRVTQSDVLARNMQRLQVPGKLLITGSVVTDAFLRSTGNINDNLLAIIPNIPHEKMAGMAGLNKKYRARYQEEMSPYAFYAYDSVNLLVAAIKKANSLEREKIVSALHDIRYNGVGGVISFNASGALAVPTYTLYQVENQKWSIVKIFNSK